MKIKKNGKVIRLNESDLKRIVKRVLNEQQDTDTEYSEAYTFCKQVEDWWEGSDDVWTDPERPNDESGTNYVDFFSKYNIKP